MPHYHLFHLHLDGVGNPTRLGYANSRDAQACMEAGLGRVQKAIDRGCYRLAATVRASSLLDLFQKTAQAGPDWADAPEIHPGDAAGRATSFGDIAVDVEAGQVFSMYRGGWKEHPIEDCAQLFLSSRRFEVAQSPMPEPEVEDLPELCAM